MKNHFLFPYAGNKRSEVEILYSNLNLDDIETIVEPFCGTSSMSYYISLQEPGKYKYVLNDNDNNLIALYNILKDENKTYELEKKINEIVNKIKNLHGQDMEKSKNFYKEIIKKNDVLGYYIKNKICKIRPGLYPDGGLTIKPIKLSSYPCINFIRNENVIFSCMDAIELTKKYKDDCKNLLFLDPPYFSTCNSFYNNPCFEYLYYFGEMEKREKKNIYLIIEKSFIVDKVLNNHDCIDEYPKKYTGHKKKETFHKLYLI